MKYLLVHVAAVLIAAATACADSVVINVGSHNLLANTANQTVQIFVTGGAQVPGTDLFAQIGSGMVSPSAIPGLPQITSVDLISGTIFAPNNSGMFVPNLSPPPADNSYTAGGPVPPSEAPQFWQVFLNTSSGTVAANGLYVTLTIDTTGINSGAFALNLGNIQTPIGTISTDFSTGPAPSITNGSITIGPLTNVLPLPSAAAGGLLLLACFALSRLARRRVTAEVTLRCGCFAHARPAANTRSL